MVDLLKFEFRRVVGEFRRGDWKSAAGIRALPAVAVAAVGFTSALAVRKRFGQDVPDKALLGDGGRATFACSSSPSRGLPSATAVQRALAQAGVTSQEMSALRRAAARFKGPIDRDLIRTEGALLEEGVGAAGPAEDAARKAAYGKLVAKWRAAGYLSEPEGKARSRYVEGLDMVTQQDESYGRDVGCEAPLCLLRAQGEREDEALRTLPAEQLNVVADALEKHGVVRLKGLVGPAEVRALRDRLGAESSTLDRKRLDVMGLAPIRFFDSSPLEEEDPELSGITCTQGRRHFHLRRRKLEDAVRSMQAGALPLVWEHLARTMGEEALSGMQPYLSEIQLLVSDPCADSQFWHVDNAQSGVTVFVPLTDVPADLGPTHFLPGTHHLFKENAGRLARYRSCSSSFLSADGVVVGAMHAGDALIYDARIIHLGANNLKYDRSRIALIFRYDVQRPPGYGAMGTQVVAGTGKMLAFVQRLYAGLPSPAPAAAPSHLQG
eukprot:TRINITY_DN19714_c0_g1_i1.p1 TRINITY_DN19714_c0_g1~~TRINITY_DN19714_c0_g1_i1.p1  ORF type:complete len:494 (-),score=80.04 TRINITY_DN19714_c0_g1_i1:137-1618(-)